MKTYLLFLVASSAFFMGSVQSPAQTGGPPKVLLIVREEIKPGMMGAHTREANNVVRIYSKARSPHHRLALVPVAGNENEVTYLWGFDSFADLEKSGKDLDTIATVTHKAEFDRVRPEGEDYHSSQRDSIAVLREDLSYRPGTDISRMRYMRVHTIRVKPGHVREFEEGRRIVNAAHQKARIDETMVVYQVAGGAQSGTYLVFIPWSTLDGLGTIPHGKAYFDAMGDNNRDKLDKIENDSIVFSAVDIYAFAPQLSYMSQQWVASDPAFWTLKPMAPEPAAPATRRVVVRPVRRQ